eukprot:359003-Chlamydomonas_euryale.AAC.6
MDGCMDGWMDGCVHVGGKLLRRRRSARACPSRLDIDTSMCCRASRGVPAQDPNVETPQIQPGLPMPKNSTCWRQACMHACTHACKYGCAAAVTGGQGAGQCLERPGMHNRGILGQAASGSRIVQVCILLPAQTAGRADLAGTPAAARLTGF